MTCLSRNATLQVFVIFISRAAERRLIGIFEYIENIYNRKRTYISLGYLTPYEFERVHEECFQHQVTLSEKNSRRENLDN